MRSAPTRDQLFSEVTKLWKRIESDVEWVRPTHPKEAEILKSYEKDLKMLAREVTLAQDEQDVSYFEKVLAHFIKQVESVLNVVESDSGQIKPREQFFKQ